MYKSFWLSELQNEAITIDSCDGEPCYTIRLIEKLEAGPFQYACLGLGGVRIRELMRGGVPIVNAVLAMDEAKPGGHVIFPAGPAESRGMEDARFVRFVDEDGSITYYATYTAFDGHQILPQLIMTDDFVTFQVRTLNGAVAQNKGMALFPRRIGGRYAMISRQDRENLFYMTSDSIRSWEAAELLATPHQPWQLIQIGTCGSPIETEAGWLLLTHGVGPMRQYAIGAMLLDLDDPRCVVGRLSEPLLTPDEHERDGYVPNVVYSCGALVHGEHLIIPYGASDQTTLVATLPIGDLLDRLLENRV